LKKENYSLTDKTLKMKRINKNRILQVMFQIWTSFVGGIDKQKIAPTFGHKYPPPNLG